MLKNADGTYYSSESVRDILDARFEEEDFPYLSDILGSDWAAHLPAPKSPEHYFDNALSVARKIYPDESGHFK